MGDTIIPEPCRSAKRTYRNTLSFSCPCKLLLEDFNGQYFKVDLSKVFQVLAGNFKSFYSVKPGSSQFNSLSFFLRSCKASSSNSSAERGFIIISSNNGVIMINLLMLYELCQWPRSREIITDHYHRYEQLCPEEIEPCYSPKFQYALPNLEKDPRTKISLSFASFGIS